jgi:hypothetical protein
LVVSNHPELLETYKNEFLESVKNARSTPGEKQKMTVQKFGKN